jgi:hypothetical protein
MYCIVLYCINIMYVHTPSPPSVAVGAGVVLASPPFEVVVSPPTGAGVVSPPPTGAGVVLASPPFEVVVSPPLIGAGVVFVSLPPDPPPASPPVDGHGLELHSSGVILIFISTST